MIKNLKACPVFNSFGRETLKVTVFTEEGEFSASIPSGTSKGRNEAAELLVERALENFSAVRKRLIGMEESPERIDKLLLELDKSRGFRKMGGNLALAISLAVARAASKGRLWSLGKRGMKGTFPLPIGNLIGGGKHSMERGCEWQEFLLIPHRARNPFGAAKTMLDVWSSVGEELRKRKLLVGKNIESAWITRMDNEKTLEFISGFTEDWSLKIGIDFAASNFWKGGRYVYKKETLTAEKHMELIEDMAKKYKQLYYLEDPFHEEDFESFSGLAKECRKCLIVGDDLYCTNLERLKRGIAGKAGRGIIIKPNQIGTISLASEAVSVAKKSRMVIIPSHRSQETSDCWLSDLSVLWEAPFIKAGIFGTERLVKHNRLIELWEEIPHVKMSRLP